MDLDLDLDDGFVVSRAIFMSTTKSTSTIESSAAFTWTWTWAILREMNFLKLSPAQALAPCPRAIHERPRFLLAAFGVQFAACVLFPF